MANHYPELNPEKALIWRILHRDNLPWVLDNGVHCGNGSAKSANWISIGNRKSGHPTIRLERQELPGQNHGSGDTYREPADD